MLDFILFNILFVWNSFLAAFKTDIVLVEMVVKVRLRNRIGTIKTLFVDSVFNIDCVGYFLLDLEIILIHSSEYFA